MCKQLIYLISFVLMLGLVAGVASGQSVKINFQKEGGEVPEGYLPDYGERFGDRGNDLSYGWSWDIQENARDWNSAQAPDQRYDTLLHLQRGGNNTWEIVLPNGVYELFLVCGDPYFTNQTNNIDVEGNILKDPDGQSGTDFDFDEFNLTVIVADGRLTIQPAPDADNSKIMFLDIVNVVDLIKAYRPVPDDGVLYEDRWADLSWMPGYYSVSHDVYFAGNFDDVNAGVESTFHGNQASTSFTIGLPGSPYPDGLIPGTTYYWRIDEVEADGTVRKGDIWSFTIPPSTAYDRSPADGVFHEDTWVNLSWSAKETVVSHDIYFGDNFDDVNAGSGDTFRGNQAETFYPVGFPGHAYPDGLVSGTTYYWRIDEVEAGKTYKGDVWSFWIPSKIAYKPNPPDGAKYAHLDVELSWMEGFGAKLHTVYFGDNFDDVNNATGGFPQGATTYTLGILADDTVYYWRVDELGAGRGAKTHKGDVWSFRTLSEIPITDPNLVCWWKFDKGYGSTALDWSGHGSHGTFYGEPQWVDGYDGYALNLDGDSPVDSVVHSFAESSWPAFTVAFWVKADTLWQKNYRYLFLGHISYTSGFYIYVDGGNPGNYVTHRIEPSGTGFGPVSIDWVHLAITSDGRSANLYYNGSLSRSGTVIDTMFNQFAIGVNRGDVPNFAGTFDDVRIYNKMLTQNEIKQTMEGDPSLAYNPKPANRSVPDIDLAISLSWSPGNNAAQHDVYFGTDKDAVVNADESDTTGIYRGRQGITSYNPPEGVEWGGGPYYWRIDEYNTNGTISKGSVWSFTVADFIVIDDFEGYDVGNNEIWWAWIDGLGYDSHPTLPAHPGNGTGSMVGDETTPSYMEETIVHGGGKSMPVFYDNDQQGKLKYSEVEKTLSSRRDWTEEGVGVLSLWFHGDSANAAETLYVALNGNAIVTNDNPNAAQVDTWTEWTIDLQAFADQGVNLANVNTIALGLGNKKNPVTGGSGKMYFDDIRLYRPPEPAP